MSGGDGRLGTEGLCSQLRGISGGVKYRLIKEHPESQAEAGNHAFVTPPTQWLGLYLGLGEPQMPMWKNRKVIVWVGGESEFARQSDKGAEDGEGVDEVMRSRN